jgi:hypothetical protein
LYRFVLLGFLVSTCCLFLAMGNGKKRVARNQQKSPI